MTPTSRSPSRAATARRVARVVLALASLALGALAAPAARAEDPPPSPPDWSAWQAGLAATGRVPAACGEVFIEFFAGSGGAPAPAGVALERRQGDANREPFARLEATGGMPYADFAGGLVRARSDFSDGFWMPRNQDRAQVNRGYALLPIDGREVMLVDHMASPITSATSLWEDTGKRVRMLAAFPGEVSLVEARPDRVVLHLNDPITASRVAWDRAKKAFVGDCMIEMQAAFVLEPTAATLAAQVPVMKTVGKGRAGELAMYPPDHDDLYRLGRLAAGTRVVALLTRPDGWTLVLAPLPDKTVWTKLFRVAPDRAWRLGWLAPGAAR